MARSILTVTVIGFGFAAFIVILLLANDINIVKRCFALPISPIVGKVPPPPVFIFKAFRGVASAWPHTVMGNAQIGLGSSVAHIKAVRCPEHSWRLGSGFNAMARAEPTRTVS